MAPLGRPEPAPRPAPPGPTVLVGRASSEAGSRSSTAARLRAACQRYVTRANAITFTGGVNSLEIQNGSTISGNAVAVLNGTDTFALGGATDSSFDTTQIGAQYKNFTAFKKTGASTWTLTGTPGQATPWVISAGTLKAGAATNVFGSTSAITVNTPGILDLAGNSQQIGSLAGSGTVTNSVAAGATLTTGDATNTAFSGVIQDGTGQTALTKEGAGTMTLSGTNTLYRCDDHQWRHAGADRWRQHRRFKRRQRRQRDRRIRHLRHHHRRQHHDLVGRCQQQRRAWRQDADAVECVNHLQRRHQWHRWRADALSRYSDADRHQHLYRRDDNQRRHAGADRSAAVSPVRAASTSPTPPVFSISPARPLAPPSRHCRESPAAVWCLAVRR